jgi:hypothetical protein
MKWSASTLSVSGASIRLEWARLFLLVMRGTCDHRYPKSQKCYRSNLRCDNQPTLSSGRAASQQLADSRTSSWSRAACFVVPAA